MKKLILMLLFITGVAACDPVMTDKQSDTLIMVAADTGWLCAKNGMSMDEMHTYIQNVLK